jgi:hypothetical protein
MARQICKRPVTEGDIPAASSTYGQQRKRARVAPENLPSSNKPSNKATSAGRPRKIAPSRVQKTYRTRQKVVERLHRVNRDVDYDEIPLATAPTGNAKQCILPPTKASNVVSALKASRMRGIIGRTNLPGPTTVGSSPAVEIPDDKKQEKKERPLSAGTCPVQSPPTETFDNDDDPIQSFSSSPSEVMPVEVDKVRAFNLIFLPPYLTVDLYSLEPKSQRSLNRLFIWIVYP